MKLVKQKIVHGAQHPCLLLCHCLGCLPSLIKAILHCVIFSATSSCWKIVQYNRRGCSLIFVAEKIAKCNSALTIPLFYFTFCMSLIKFISKRPAIFIYSKLFLIVICKVNTKQQNHIISNAFNK